MRIKLSNDQIEEILKVYLLDKCNLSVDGNADISITNRTGSNIEGITLTFDVNIVTNPPIYQLPTYPPGVRDVEWPCTPILTDDEAAVTIFDQSKKNIEPMVRGDVQYGTGV